MDPNSKSVALNESVEWLEPDGLGGYASGTVVGLRTRRYHALLLTATTPPTGRVVLVNGFDAWVDLDGKRLALSSQRYLPDVVSPDGRNRLQSFTDEPWPRWVWQLAPGIAVSLELFVPHGVSACVLSWTLVDSPSNSSSSVPKLVVRPFLSGRDYHGMHHQNTAFHFEAQSQPLGVTWKPYPGIPAITALTNGSYHAEPDWYRNFLYEQERERGLDFVEDLASPGTFTMDLNQPAALIFVAEGHVEALTHVGSDAATIARSLADSERKRRAAFGHRLTRSADAYIVHRDRDSAKGSIARSGRTIIAGYPWFTDWGRDTFIALRGLCLADRRMQDAAEILGDWADTISEGMLPNRFPDQGGTPEYNSVDASLWYVVAVGDFLTRSQTEGPPAPAKLIQKLRAAVQAILSGYFRGTRYGIRCDADGLLQAGVPGVQLTWMDVKIGDWVVTPRIGKPVEVEALWLAALKIGGQFDSQWSAVYTRGMASFRKRFWNESHGCLYDVVDLNHQSGQVDETVRPNQIFAVGGLPDTLIDAKQARCVVDLVEQRLWTPLGLRTLDPADPAYAPRYVGAPKERDPAYHQGTVWPWLAGAFIEAWVRVRGDSPQVRTQARTKFLQPLLEGLHVAGLGHLPEVADGDAPHTPRGCPFQAWSLGELIRVQRMLDSSKAG
ncbi:MAG TPA: amylo-alpha-1,6-glucosidase [Planctomycetaceae bacterium]|nr:amylo-alpha-1,6-glucosidase [Planctomycetaceae bacterium]